MATPAPALALLALAAVLAGFGGAVRALTGVDGKPRPSLMAVGVAAGVLASALSLAPLVLGPEPFTVDISTLGILGVAGMVATADLVQVGRGLWLVARAWPSRSALREGRAAMSTGDAARAAEAYARAVNPLVQGRRHRGELDARIELVEALVAAGDLNQAAIRLHEALEVGRGLGDAQLMWVTLLRAAVIDADLDRLPMARRHLGEAAMIARERLTDQHVANVFAELGWIAYLGGDRELAGICLAWAGRAAGKIDPTSPFMATTTLLAAYLSLGMGDLVAAESALTAVGEVAAAVHDPDLDAGAQVGRVCLAYLQGWKDTARDSFAGLVPGLHQARWRSRLVLPLIALSIQARGQERPADATAFANAAAELAAKGGTLGELAELCADPAADLAASPRAIELENLLAKPAQV
jgi:tetratricopeptide (TPR) repeat protein